MAVNKGQAFMLGTMVLVAVVMGGFLLQQSGVFTAPATGTTKPLFDQAVDEFPAAVNLAAAHNGSAETVQRRTHAYLAFQRYVLRQHATDIRSHAVVSVPNRSGTDIVLVNFRGTSMTEVTVTVDGTAKTVDAIQDDGSRIVAFGTVPATFDVTLNASADRAIDTRFSASRDRITPLFSLRLDGPSQVWSRTKVY